MSTAKTKYPKTLYVAWEDTNDGPYLQVDEDYAGYAVINDDRKIAVYQLVEVKTLTAKAELE